MGIMARAKVAAESTATPPCDACKAADTTTQAIAGDVRICVAQAPCIARAKTAGIWKQS